MKKRIAAFLLAVSAVFSVMACAGTESTGKMEMQSSKINDRRERLAQEFQDEKEPQDRPEAGKESGTGNQSDIKKESEQDPEAEMNSESKSLDQNGLSDKLSDCQVSINGIVYQFPMRYSEFEALGWEFSGDSTQVLEPEYWDMPTDLWHKDGYGAYVVLANPFSKEIPYSESMVSGIILMEAFLEGSDWEIILPGGIQYGVSGVEDIREAYGDPAYGNEQQGTYTFTYTYQGGADREIILSVYGEDKTLKYIDIKNILRLDTPEIDQELRILE